MAIRSASRRRQRSVRVTVSVTLLGVATVLVVLALPTQSALILSIAAVAAIVLGWAALRMMWTEVLQSRRENAADRVAAATAYRTLFSQRAAEHAEFTTAMTERLAESQMTMRELQGLLVAEQRRAASAESGLSQSNQRLEETQTKVAALEAEIARREAEEADALAIWEGEGGEASVADLVAFDESVTRKTARTTAEKIQSA
ncbi:hypothetical protein [Nocardioides terrisoli]|uniref:hypothetical protein n=1 Tax=Nocardioides terrisoli TaxID=3388267 RepID=UPI00287B9C48|nr:hypothetical protein [Nocardioides marmorisolisilvae]